MLYTNNTARENARESIKRMHAVLANIPFNVVGLADIQTMHHLLRIMDGELNREIRENA